MIPISLFGLFDGSPKTGDRSTCIFSVYYSLSNFKHATGRKADYHFVVMRYFGQ